MRINLYKRTRKKVCGLPIDTKNGFLYNMVRIIAGTLVSVGRGFLSWEEIPQIILSKERKRAGITAPPEGLMLYEIEYE